MRNEVRIDARPSDCLVLALKNSVDIYVTPEVFEQVQDVSKMTGELESNLAGLSLGEFEVDIRGGSSGEGGGESPEGDPSEDPSDEDGEDEHEKDE